MKVLETGQASEMVLVMSWSPKMDLLAIGTSKASVELHRLSWQKVWQLPLAYRGTPAIPDLIAWHPEGLFLIVASGGCTFVIDVECGKVVHSHELHVRISVMKWCASAYLHTINDVLFTQSRQQTDNLRNDLKIQRLETNLSVLFLGTVNGYIYAYTGGFLLGFCIHLCEDGSPCQILQMDASPTLDVFQFISDEEAGYDDMILTFSHFRNEYLPPIAPIIGPLGLKYILFLKNWNMIQSEISSLNDHWSRLVDLYNLYMTFGTSKSLQVARVDYLELLLTGITCVEMELFLGDSGREKEAKKSINAINAANASMTEQIRTIKCSTVNLLTELNEIGGFLMQISGYDEASKLMVKLQKSCNYLFLATLHIQSLVHNFVEVLLHFMHMIMNTIHSFNVQEVQDYIEEDADTDKVLEFLETNVDKDIFQFLMKNVSLGCKETADGSQPKSKRRSFLGGLNFPETNAIGVTASASTTRDFSRVPEIIYNILQKQNVEVGSFEKHSMLMDYTETEVNEFLSNVIPTINCLTKELLAIPVLCLVPFEVDMYQITRLPKAQYFTNSQIGLEVEPLLIRRPFLMSVDHYNFKATLSCLWSPRKLLFFEVEYLEMRRINVKSACLNFTRNMMSIKIFSDAYITLVSFEETPVRELQESSKTIVCQIQYRPLLNQVASIELNHVKSKCGLKSTLPTNLYMEIPVDISKPYSLIQTNQYLDCVLPIEGFTPAQLEVSGPRKVGALLADNRRTVLLLEMETDLSETSYDDTVEVSESGESYNSNEVEDEDD